MIGLIPFFLACLVEFNRAIHIAGIGECKHRHLVIFCGFHELFDLWQGIEQGIVRMRMEMDEFVRHNDMIIIL